MLNVDPRYLIADIYKKIRGSRELTDEFTQALNKVQSPQEAVLLCLEWSDVKVSVSP